MRVSRTYSLPEVASLLDVHQNTVRRWLGAGLIPLDAKTPVLIHGAELRRFLSERSARRKRSCAPDEMPCFRCRAARRPIRGSVCVAARSEKTVTLRGVCTVCGGGMWRAGSAAKLALYAKSLGPITAAIPRLSGQGFSLVNGDGKEDREDADLQPQE